MDPANNKIDFLHPDIYTEDFSQSKYYARFLSVDSYTIARVANLNVALVHDMPRNQVYDFLKDIQAIRIACRRSLIKVLIS